MFPGAGLYVIGAFPPAAIVALSCATRLAVKASLNFFAPKPTIGQRRAAAAPGTPPMLEALQRAYRASPKTADAPRGRSGP